jgi:hypothetical protein
MRNQRRFCANLVPNFALSVFLVRHPRGHADGNSSQGQRTHDWVNPIVDCRTRWRSCHVVACWRGDPTAPPADLTLDQVRSQFLRRGYDVREALRFDWTSPPVTFFQVRDGLGTTDRVLMVLLYPDSAAARSEHLQAQARDETAQNWSLVYSDDHGPRLVPGYGQSVWWQNVALVQSSRRELNQLFTDALDRDNQIVVQTVLDRRSAMQVLTFSAMQAVDQDFVALLSDATGIDL